MFLLEAFHIGIFILKQVHQMMSVILLVDLLPRSHAVFHSDIMESLTTNVPMILLMEIFHGAPLLLMITTIMSQVEVIMVIVDPTVHYLLVGQCKIK